MSPMCSTAACKPMAFILESAHNQRTEGMQETWGCNHAQLIKASILATKLLYSAVLSFMVQNMNKVREKLECITDNECGKPRRKTCIVFQSGFQLNIILSYGKWWAMAMRDRYQTAQTKMVLTHHIRSMRPSGLPAVDSEKIFTWCSRDRWV